METLTTTIFFILLLALICVPVLIFLRIKKQKQSKFNFLSYLTIGMFFTAGLIWSLAWWAHYSDQLLMSHYGYDFDAMNESARFERVEMENLERVKQLETGYSGVGWPLQALMAFIYYWPYLLIVYIFGEWIMRAKRKNKVHAPNISSHVK